MQLAVSRALAIQQREKFAGASWLAAEVLAICWVFLWDLVTYIYNCNYSVPLELLTGDRYFAMY
jgi:hypothetical protein